MAVNIGLLVAGLAVLGLSLRVGRWLKAWITQPMSDMTQAMTKLAGGDLAITVPSLGWADEMGQMAKAVQTFKKNAIEQRRLENEAVEARRLSEGERAEHEAEKAREAQDRQQAILMLGEGLGRLAGGDLVHRIETPFAPSTEKLRSEFNVSVEQLQQTMLTIISNAEAIRSGTGEISAAADDLSRRTEQQAASLEQTAAALDEITATVRKTAEGGDACPHRRLFGQIRSGQRRPSCPPRDNGDERDREILAADRPDHRRDRRDRIPDQSARTQCRRRSRPCGRRGQGLRRRRLGGQSSGAAFCRGPRRKSRA